MAHHPRPLEEWTRLFRRTFRFTGGLIVGEFLMSLGFLPGAHQPDCPVYTRILALAPPWARGRMPRLETQGSSASSEACCRPYMPY